MLETLTRLTNIRWFFDRKIFQPQQDPKKDGEPPVENSSQDQKTTHPPEQKPICPKEYFSTPSPDTKITQGAVEKNPHYKEVNPKNSIKELNKDLSHQELHPELQEYFQELRPKAKREDEWTLFSDLRKDCSQEEIASALRWVQKNGVLASGDACHSPMAYLSKAIMAVLNQPGVIQKNNKTLNQKTVFLAQLDAEQQEASEQFDSYARAFEETFSKPEDRKSYLEKVLKALSRF